MGAIAVDASAVAAVLFMEPEGESLVARMDGDLIAPLLLPFEVANVCRSKMARDPARASGCAMRYKLLPRLGISLLPIDFDELPGISLEHGLTSYDAAYLQLALEHGAPLVTLDEQLDRAWRRARPR